MSQPKPPVRERLSHIRGDGFSSRSSLSSLSLITPPKRKTLKMPVGNGPRCSHCQQPVTVSGQACRRRGSSDSDTSLQTEPKLSLQEALQTFPDESATIQPYTAPPRRMTKRIAPDFTFHRPKLTRICSRFVTNIRQSQRLRITSPPRPPRPHPSKCPSPPEVILTAQTKYPEEDEHASYKTGRATRTKEMGTTHHNRAYRLLTGDLAAREDSERDTVTDSDHLRTNFSLVQTAPERKNPCLGLWYRAHGSSSSTLPTTASKLALKPSPLHLGRDDASQDIPPVPVRSSFRDVMPNAIAYPAVKALSIRSTTTRTRSSSYTTASVYSDGENSTIGETPLSSPPRIPLRRESVLPSTIGNASSKADQMRAELGLVDGVYSIIAEGVQNRCMEGLTPEYTDQVTSLSTLSREQPEKLSRTKRRVAKERARLLAAQQLSSDRAVRQDTEFELWLHDAAAAQSRPAYHCQIRESQACEAMEQFWQEEIQESPSSETPEDTQLSTLSEPESSPSTPRKQPTVHETCNEQPQADEESILSLKGFRSKLMMIMEADSSSEDQPNTSLISRRCQIPSPSALSRSSSGSQEDLDLLGFRRFEILWKGKRYPVLISEGGNIREGPCLHTGCQQHGSGVAESVHGFF